MRRAIDIVVAGDDGPQKLSIDAEIVGAFGIHASPGVDLVSGEEAWSVTHLATGYHIVPLHFPTVETARAYCAFLAHVPVDWTASDPTKTVADYLLSHVVSIMRSGAALHGGFLVQSLLDHTEGSA